MKASNFSCATASWIWLNSRVASKPVSNFVTFAPAGPVTDSMPSIVAAT